MDNSEDQKMEKLNLLNGFSLADIKTHIKSKYFINFVKGIQEKNIFTPLIEDTKGGSKIKSRKKRKRHYRKTMKYGGNPKTMKYGGNPKKYKRYSVMTIFLIALSLPSNLVPDLFNTIFTSTQEQLSTNIFEPFTTAFPEITSGFPEIEQGIKKIESGVKESNAAKVVEYGKITIEKNYNDFSKGGILVLNGLYALYLNGGKVYNYFSDNGSVPPIKELPKNIEENEQKQEPIDIQQEQENFKRIFDDTVELMSKVSQLIEIPIPDGSKLLIPMDATLCNKE
jgi:hypothetical protein